MLNITSQPSVRQLEENSSKSSSGIILDFQLMTVILAMLAVGLIMVGSASMDVSHTIFGNPFHIVLKQALFLLVGIAAIGVMLFIPINFIYKYSWCGLLLALLLLITVLLIGREVNGSIRWISLGFVNFQASELAKLVVIMYMAGYLVRHLDQVRTRWIGFVKPMLVLMLLSALLLAEPDFGSVVVLSAAILGMIFMAGARIHQFLLLIILVSLGITILVVIEPYRVARLTSYMDPWANAFGSGYQLTQALIAFGRGGGLGQGLGNSIQKLFYLPEAHTDFVFAVLAEEFGLIGSLLALAAFIYVSRRALQLGFIAESNNLMFHGYVAYGIALLFSCQSLINIGVNVGLLPTKGIALPLISYGGSSMIVNCIALGVLLRIDYERRLFSTVKRLVIAGRKRINIAGGIYE